MVTIGVTKPKIDVVVNEKEKRKLVFDYDEKLVTWNERLKTFKEEVSKTKGVESELLKNEKFHKLLDEFNKEYYNSLIVLPPYEGVFYKRDYELKAIRNTIANILEPTRVIIGEAGTGKTTLVREATRRINAGLMENKMGYNLICVELSLLALLEGGENKFASIVSRILPALEELEKEARKALEDENIKFILFIDEIHTLTKAVQKESGESIGADGFKRNIKPEFGSLIIFGATTEEEYGMYIQHNTPLRQRFSSTTVLNGFSKEDVEKISSAHWEYMRKARGIKNSHLPIEYIRYIINTNAKIDLKSSEPRKTKQFLQNLDAHSFNEGYEPDVEMIKECFLLSKNIMSEVPLNIDKTMKAIDNDLKGQYGAKYIAKRTIVSRHGNLRRTPNSAFLSFLLLGPTGVGKTQFAKILNDNIFDGKGKFVKMNCSDYAYIDNGVQKFLREAGERIGTAPCSILLIDEVEKAIPSKRNQGIRSSLRDIFLDLTGEGILKYTPRMGGEDDVVSLSNTIIIFTSNAGYKIFESDDKFSSETITKKTSNSEIRQIMNTVVRDLKRNLHKEYNFAREFFGRLDAVIPFTSLKETDGIEIAERMLNEFIKQADEKENIEVIIDDKIEYDHDLIRGIEKGKKREFHPLAVTIASYLADMTNSAEGGARQIEEEFQFYVDNILGEIKLNRKGLERKKIVIFPKLFDPLTGEPDTDEEAQELTRMALDVNRKEDIEIVYEEV